MKVINGVSQLKKALPKTVLTIGNFDGLHLGHQEIIKTLLKAQKKNKTRGAVMTFDPHPSQILTPHKYLHRINTLSEKKELLQKWNIDYFIVEPFTLKLASQTPEFFFYEILLKKMNPQVIVVGHDFNFGKNRSGNIELLKKLGYKENIEIIVVPPFKKDGEIVSSSFIRKLIQEGNVEKAHRFLGRPFFIEGKVVHGSGRGKKIKTPTANLRTEDRLVPQDGVYIIETECDGKRYPSCGSIGYNITFSEKEPHTIEVFILDFDKDLYDKTLRLHYMKKIRAMEKFSNVEKLQQAIESDIQKTRVFFHER
ncbi:MAG: bifunctional riboflavin kinase/FAD synthetase [Deltaproteobacteria bacterium]|nr:bifunctional riboflavin kinase/FAD synthetase [Deltaproteobacteria bacterium]